MHWARALNHWIHLLSVMVFTGGLAFLVMTLKPAIREQPQVSARFLYAVARRFKRMAFALMVLILASGAANALFRVREMGSLPRGYIVVLGLKLALVVAVFTIYLYLFLIGTGPEPPETPTSDAAPRIHPSQAGALLDLGFARVAFVLAVVIVFLAAALRTWH